MATLTLEPDEILPDTPAPLTGEASGPFPIFWRGKERQFVFRAVEIRRKNHVIFAREVDNEAAGNWLIYERETLIPTSWSSAPPRKQLENLALEFATRDWELGRFFTISGIRRNRSFRVLLLGNDVGAWLDVDRRFRMAAAFDLAFPAEVSEFNRNLIRPFWECEMAVFDSNIGFAARWAGDGDYKGERNDLVFGERKAEIYQVMEWVLKCEPRLWECGTAWDWKLSPRSADFSYLFCPEADNFKNFAVNLPFIYAMGRFLVEEHIPQVVESLRKQHRCVRDFLQFEHVWIDYFSEIPTAHEQLEAALNLREWLRKNKASASIESFLSESLLPR